MYSEIISLMSTLADNTIANPVRESGNKPDL